MRCGTSGFTHGGSRCTIVQIENSLSVAKPISPQADGCKQRKKFDFINRIARLRKKRSHVSVRNFFREMVQNSPRWSTKIPPMDPTLLGPPSQAPSVKTKKVSASQSFGLFRFDFSGPQNLFSCSCSSSLLSKVWPISNGLVDFPTFITKPKDLKQSPKSMYLLPSFANWMPSNSNSASAANPVLLQSAFLERMV